jgi:hypothetical protein
MRARADFRTLVQNGPGQSNLARIMAAMTAIIPNDNIVRKATSIDWRILLTIFMATSPCSVSGELSDDRWSASIGKGT